MKISGFTIIKNAVINDYPIVEAITSILPVVQEMVVLVGASDDDTEGLIKSIQSPKLRIYPSVWDSSLRKGGEVLAVETNKAFDLVSPDSDWAFYIQADEVVHEQYHDAITAATREHANNTQVEGLLFKYLHFYGTYDYVGDSRRWYHKEVRIIRNDKSIRSYRDAQGFRKNRRRLAVKPVDAYIYHYGWVKTIEQMRQKQKHTSQYWADEKDMQKANESIEVFDYSDFDSLDKFRGTHPAVMNGRIAKKNWQIEFNISQKKFSLADRLLYGFEKKTGVRLFDFRNYRII